MFKRKQLQELQESERRELGLETEDFECISSDSDSEMDESSCNAEMSDDDNIEEDDDESKSGPTKTKVMILGSRGINSRYNIKI